MTLRRLGKVLLVLLCGLFFSSISFAGTLPSTFFGMHINRTATTWPGVTFGSYRMWDDGTAWANINTSAGVYNWSTADSWVSKAQQHNVQLLYTFGRTPQWASSSPTTTCNYGSGQCVAPADYANWDKFVTALVTRYKGKIKYYEMWNEPNDLGFWKGTTAQVVEMTIRAANIIHSIDPNAEVVSPGATWTSTTAWAWLDGYLAAGAGPYLDDIGFHGYTGNNKADGIFSIIDNIAATQSKYGYSLPLIISEGGWGRNTVITDQDAQAAFLVQRYLLITARPAVKSFFWYQWDNADWGTLWDSTNGMHKAGVAYGQLTSWLIGASAQGCVKDASYTWTCSYTLASGVPALAVWNATASVNYTPGSQYTQVLRIDGSSSSINGSSSYTVSNKPVLFAGSSIAPTSVSLAVTPTTGITPVAASATVTAAAPTGVTVKSTSISFGDGTTVSAATGSHTYSNAGSYTVQATVTDSLNRTTTSSKTVTVTAPQPPVAALSVTPATGKVPLAVTASSAASKDADGTITSSSINFGDGTVVSGTTVSHTYTTAGTYSVTTTVTDNQGLSSTATVTVTASNNQPPVAKLALTQSGMTVTASTTGSYDPDGTISSTVIKWGDGASTNAASGSHTYSASGTYTVTATVTDNSGATSSATQSVVVQAPNKPPVAVISLSQSGMTVTASTAGSYDPDGTIASTVIKWGDGTSTNAALGSHTYSASGTYTVTATVTDNSGASSSASKSVVVQVPNKPPVAVMTLTQTAPMSYKVSTTGSYDPDGYLVSTVISWGDGRTTSATSASHTYSKPGTYTVTVTVKDNKSATGSISGSATPNWGIFVAEPASGSTVGSPVHFVASAAAQHGISSTKILVDGNTVYSGTSWLIDTNIAMATGTRNVVIQANGKSGTQYQASLSITVQ